MGKVLSVSELEKAYEVRKAAFSLHKTTVKALDKVSFDLDEGKTLGIVGESGSGKSTLARCLLLLEKPDGGTIDFQGQNLPKMSSNDQKKMRMKMQIIFQDPYSSLNPRKKIIDALSEPIMAHKIVNRHNVHKKVVDILKDVGLDEDFLNKYPHEMSGGQRQRVAIGRAIATNPALLIADEPVSSLDVSIQAQIINLFMDIKRQSKVSMIFVSHDLNIVRYISDEIMVMYKGKVMEMGKKDEVFLRPLHPYTRMLVTAAQGKLCVAQEKEIQFLEDEACVYYQRCELGSEICSKKTPRLACTKKHSAACFNVSN